MARILSVISAVSKMGGTNTKLRALMKASKHEHFLYHPGYEKNRHIIEKEIPFFSTIGVKAYYGIYNRNIFAHVYKLNKIIKDDNIEIVHFYFNFENIFLPILKFLNPQVVFVRSIVGYEKPLPWWRQIIMNYVINRTDNFIFISHYIKDTYEAIYPSLKRKNAEIIYNGAVNVKQVSVQLEDKWRIVNVSVLEERKNLSVLIEALGLIKNKYHRTDIELYILGEGSERKHLEGLVSNYNLYNQVHLIGYSSDVANYLNECSVYVHPATTEGFGISVVEAMQMYCACIVADKGALPELVVNELNGFVVDAYNPEVWAEKIVYLVDHQDERVKMAVESYKRAQNDFSLESFVNHHDNYYNKLARC